NYLDAITRGVSAMSTIHSGGSSDLIKRMIAPPVNASFADISAVDAIIELKNEEKRSVDRVSEIFNENGLMINHIFEKKESGYENSGYSYLLKRISKKMEKPEDVIESEIAQKKSFLESIRPGISYVDFYESLNSTI
ncbi:MAG: hypothetical protein ACP5UV_03155, partial [Thermoplasmata archaeon]